MPLDPATTTGSAANLKAQGSTVGATLQLLRFAIDVDGTMFWLTVGMAVLGSVAEGFGLVLLLPLLSVAGMNFTGSTTASRLSTEAQRLLVTAGIPHGLWLPVVLAVFLATGAARSMLRRTQSAMVYTTMTRVQLALSERVYRAVVRARWGFLVRQRGGRLTHVLTAELQRVLEAVGMLLSILAVGCMALLYLVVAFRLSSAMTVMVLALGCVLLLLQRRSLAQVRESGAEFNDSVAEVYSATEEHLLNLKSVKTYNNEARDAAMFSALCRQVAHRAVVNAKHQAASEFRFEVGSLVALGAVVYLALAVVHVQSATLLILLAVFTRLMPQLSSLQSQTNEVATLLPSFQHVLAIEAECRAQAEPEAPVESGADRLALRREFRLEDVWFAYDGAAVDYVLRGVDLEIEAGTMTALVGPSGAGKSTIADLMNGLLTPARGRVVLDGQVLGSAAIQQWRRHVGYVGQETVLFHMTVRENLLWARPEASDAELRRAMELVSADFVYALPLGLETVVGDRGILLSSGQRQRIAVARALLRRPALLILDEATNALDVDNEARLLDGIRAAMAEAGSGMTVLMIAHRASAIQRADRVFELQGGCVVRSGTAEEFSRA